MKNVFMLLGAIVAASVVIQQIINNKKGPRITSREDDPSIPPVSRSAF